MSTVTNVDSLTIGGRTFSDPDSLLVLFAAGGGASAEHSGFRKLDFGAADSSATPAYSVPGGETYTIKAIKAILHDSGAGNFELITSDDAVAWETGTGPSTNRKNFAFTPGNQTFVAQLSTSANSQGVIEIGGLNLVVAASRFITYKDSGTTSWTIYLYGIEA